MEVFQLSDMVKGWFVGDFTPTALQTTAVEVAVKRYHAGDSETPHVHRVATELTVVITGTIEMAGGIFGPGSIVTLEPGEPTAFRAIDDAITVVVKIPSVRNDKYPMEA
jgi:hypothetical protein